MRNQLFVLGSSFLVAAVGCGDDGGSSVHLPDAKVFNDAAIDAPKVCSTPATIPAGALGTSAMPRARQNFFKPMGATTIEFGLGIAIDQSATPDVLYFLVPQPTGGFQANVPYSFQTDATAQTGDAFSFLDGDEDAMGNAVQMLWPSQGTITFTAIGTAMNSAVNGTVTMVPYKEIDLNSGAVIAGGCQTTLAGFTFYLTQNAAPPARTAPSEGIEKNELKREATLTLQQ